MVRTWVLIGALLGLTGVALGAFGAHGLDERLQANGRADTFETAVRYHLIHAVALIAVGALAFNTPSTAIQLAGLLMTVGTLIFSGALYILAIFDVRIMGAIAPIGGALMIAGWGALGWAAWTYQAP